ncbi:MULTISPECIES: SRPBCC family protein [unclassified Novosphingobium]|uniref:SRPBCC family protein n=1 Tax=unclassified Novosphingobium TaxID=2644732 RepID=UPI00135B76D7|nr:MULTISPECIES: SRPBCC family protein [unclassified Novosphingobium]
MKRFAIAFALPIAFGAAAAPLPAAASVAQVSQNGFVVRHVIDVSTSAEETWALLIKPSVWWDSDHTWSGEAANLSLDARAGGCFCEILPNASSPKGAPRGSVEHMRVVYIERPRAVRLVGALGPLQADAAIGTLTIQLNPKAKGGTQVLLEYVVGGFTRTPFEKLAPGVDGMLGQQVRRLGEKLGGSFAAAFPLPEQETAAEMAVPGAVPEPVEAGPATGGVVPLAQEPLSADGMIVGR